MKKYFIYELKRNLAVIGFLTLAAVVVYVAPLLIQDSRYMEYDVGMATISAIGGVLAALAPVWLFSYKMKRRSSDLFYSLPLSHTKILTCKFLFGLLAIFIPYTAAFWLGSFVVMARVGGIIQSVWYVPQFFGSVIPIIMIYAMSAFVFTRANKALDGAVFIIGWTFAVELAVQLILTLIQNGTHLNFNTETCAFSFLPFKPLDRLTVVMNGRIVKDYYYENINNAEKISLIVGFILNALLAAGAAVGFILGEKYCKSENVGQISESWFGYKVLIPLYTVCLIGIFDISIIIDSILILMIVIAMFAMIILYKRSIKVGKRQTIIFVASIAAGLFISILNSFVI